MFCGFDLYKEGGKRKGEIFHLLAPCPNAYNRQGCIILKSESRNSSGSPRGAARDLITCIFTFYLLEYVLPSCGKLAWKFIWIQARHSRVAYKCTSCWAKGLLPILCLS